MEKTNRNTILIIEDDWELNQGIKYSLQKEGYQAIGVYSLGEAMEEYHRKQAELALVLLDVNLPDGTGFAFCQWVKERHNIPVLFLSARDLEEDILRGYELGAEDYVTKPFSMNVLLKKIAIVSKRAAKDSRQIYQDGHLWIDFDQARMEVDGQECAITPTEFRLLRQLVLHPGQLLTYGQLLDRMWEGGGQFMDKHALAVNVNRLRGKIEEGSHRYISNVYGMGYQWVG